MKKLNVKRLAALAMTLVMLLGVLTACGDKADTNNGSGDGEGFPTMTIQIAHVNPTTDDDQYNKLATLFAEKVTAATDGAVTFEICGNSELGGEADVLTGFDLGTHQMGIITNGSYGNLYGPSLVVELPFIFKDNETAWNFLDGDIMKEVTDGLYDTLGYKVLAWGEGGFRNILSQKPIRTPADLKGMKIRVPGMEMFMTTFQTIGAAPSALDFNETFTAVQQHMMDGLALPIARQAAPLLRPGQFYLDMNTTSPQTKREIAAVFADSQGDFVEGAVMASVPVNGSRVPVSVCGAKAKEAAELLNSHGMKFTYLSDDIGLASATKALRSVLAKGIIALVTETVFATDHYHITEEVLDKMKVTMFDERGFMGFCHYCVASAAIHNGRFCHEMEEVLKTLDDLGENSIMTQATLKKFEWLQQEGYAAYFPERAKTYDEVLAVKKMLDEKKGEKANV